MKLRSGDRVGNDEVLSVEHSGGVVRIAARYKGTIACPDCGGEELRSKGRYQGTVRHESWGMRQVFLILEARKWRCRACPVASGSSFPGS